MTIELLTDKRIHVSEFTYQCLKYTGMHRKHHLGQPANAPEKLNIHPFA